MGEQLDLWISCAAAFPARMSAPPETNAGSRVNEAGCGSRCAESCPKCGRLGSLLRTSLLCELMALTKCSATWSAKATPAGRSWSVLTISARPIEESGCGFSRERWPTPTAGDAKASGSRTTEDSAAHPGISLTDAAVHGLTIQSKARRRWATPTARDWKDSANQTCCDEDHRHCDLLPRQVFAGQHGEANPSTSGSTAEPSPMLNANWVFQMMGYPPTWARLSTARASRLPAMP